MDFIICELFKDYLPDTVLYISDNQLYISRPTISC